MIEIARFARGDDIRLRAFNARLAASGFRLPTTPEELSTPAEPGAGPWTDLWVAHVAGTVRGGYLLKHETLWLRGKTTPIGNFQLPLSEGILDRRFAAVGLALAQHAQRQADALYSLGMGDVARPLPKLLARLGWRVEPVPFYFRILNGARWLAICAPSTPPPRGGRCAAAWPRVWPAPAPGHGVWRHGWRDPAGRGA